MERELEKTLLEIECSIKDHKRRGNTHTQSVLEQARDIVAMCAQAARTPSALKEILERKAYNDGWIPVEERLPKVGGYVLGTNKYGEVLVYHYGWNGPHSKKMFFHLCGAAATIIAWRPLSEPYRPKKESEGSRRLREREEFFKG